MPFETWVRFVAFWILFVTTPGPNAVNCITNGQAFGFWRSLPGVAAILAQATLFLTLGATGVAGLLLAAPQALVGLQIAGAAVLIWFGVRGWHRAKSAISQPAPPDPNRMFWTGFAIA
ncbi:MAG: LysE family translocator, partial [Paracoccaceae bacterium]